MNNLMNFESKQVEVFEWNGQVLFNPKHVAECLDIKNVNDNISKMNSKQVIKLTNSKIGKADFRKLHNTGENFLTESGVYKLIFKSKKAEAERFQDWVTDEVLPQIRKTGSYANNQNSINEFKGQLTTMVNNLFEDKLKEVKEYYKINSKSKFDLSSYIKKRLGILRADDEYEQVKARVFLLLNINKWEDLNVENYKDVLPVIDESIRIIKLDRLQQIGMWD
ncbi:BRO family protein [Clostridium sp. LQ25]|uniref:BRO-N domain-containing protein n=1 Tax=Clostridium sp. LQ25 TaxID=2992805 RepID=UPI00224E3E08|nr:BRO family protein [Clostridium sp. LQ25]UZT07879.1 BRO family protein [Clostridium sp. LQ25]